MSRQSQSAKRESAHKRSRVASQRSLKVSHVAKLIQHINRKAWWHVPPTDARAYEKRGKFLASSFNEAEFYGRPSDEPEKVNVTAPIVGDDQFIERELLGRVESNPNMSIPKRLALDARLRRSALRHGFDSIVFLTPSSFRQFKNTGRIPRSIELNIVDLRCVQIEQQDKLCSLN